MTEATATLTSIVGSTGVLVTMLAVMSYATGPASSKAC